jgi:CBS domain-containing protein
MNDSPRSVRNIDTPVGTLDGRDVQSPRRFVPTPKWSWKLTRVFGIDVYVHQTFLLLIAFVAVSSLSGGQGLAEGGTDIRVLQAMRGEPDTASSDDGLDGALSRMHENGIRALAVVEHQEIVGLLTVGNIGELLAFEAAGRHSGPALARTDPE